MKLSQIQKPAPPVSAPAPAGQAALPVEPSVAPQEELGFTSVTPSGIEVYYQPAMDEPKQRRLYRVNGTEVPSVTNILKIIDEPGSLIWWGMKIGIAGALQAANSSLLVDEKLDPNAPLVESVVAMLKERKLTVNDRKNEASTRGTNVHKAMELWCDTGSIPQAGDFPETEAGYVEGLAALLSALGNAVEDIEAEVMVGSVAHQFAGRCDLTFLLTRPVEVVTRVYPKRKPKIEEIPAGRHRWDLKTSKNVMPKHHLQNEAYEAAAIECGYKPTDYRAIAHVTSDGKYELALNKDWRFEDFLAVRHCYQVMNEREVVRVLREELDAKEVA